MKHFSREQLQQARRADLYAYLRQFHGMDIVTEGHSIHPRNNRSLSIRRGYSGYTDFATGETGNAIDYLTRYLGYSLDDAVFALCGDNGTVLGTCAVQDQQVNNSDAQNKKLPVVFPKPSDGQYRQVFAYLLGRGIPAVTVQSLIDQKLLYQSKDKNNCVFINKERDWAELRGTYTFGAHQFHGVVANCRSDGFWWFRSRKDASVAYVCEAAIDAISLYLLHVRNEKKTPAYYISIGGVAKQSAIDRIKRQIKTILAVDNDDAGQKCRDRNPDLEAIVPVRKDWNDDLQAELKERGL